jgi:hypothetical protein
MPMKEPKPVSNSFSPLLISGAFPSHLPIGPRIIPKSPAELSGFLANHVTTVRSLPFRKPQPEENPGTLY